MRYYILMAGKTSGGEHPAPTVGWPANGISLVGVKMLRPAVNVVEEDRLGL
jgi:hypothetical protein